MERTPLKIKYEDEPVTLEEKIQECMIHNPMLGGRYTFEIDKEDGEEIMLLATKQHHNSICPEIRTITENGKEIHIPCGKHVSCVCTSECNHIWYCPDHVLNHAHKQAIKEKVIEINIGEVS